MYTGKRKNNAIKEEPPAKKQVTEDLRSVIMKKGVKSNVKVNQRALIDKMLSRYAGNFSTFRELIQNADDAGSSEVSISFTSKSDMNEFKKITEIKVTNDGRPFTDKDWERISKIAEGNPDEQTVGMFGVGFYSVFSLTDNPMIYSNKEWMVFHWQGDQLCVTHMNKSDKNQQIKLPTNHTIAFIFPEIQNSKLSFELSQFEQFMESALFFSKNLSSIKLYLNEKQILETKKAKPENNPKTLHIPFSPLKLSTHLLSLLYPFIKKEKDQLRIQERLKMSLESISYQKIQIWTINNKNNSEKNQNLILVDAQLIPRANENFQEECMKILKKNLPSKTRCSLLFYPDGSIQIGKIYVGISTHQKTGCKFHTSGHFYPTIERENIDFQNNYLSHWNTLLLYSIAFCSRIFYNYLLKNTKNIQSLSGFSDIFSFTSIYSFLPTDPPQEIISEIFISGFFECQAAPLLYTSSGTIVPSDECYICESEILSFLNVKNIGVSIPSHKYNFKSGFFEHLTKRKLIKQLPLSIIEKSLLDHVLTKDQMGKLLSWILKKMSKCSTSDKRIFRKLANHATYREDFITDKKSFAKIKKFSTLGKLLPVPKNVLSFQLSCNFSPHILQNEFNLKEYDISGWVHDFLSKSVHSESLLSYMNSEYYAPGILAYLSKNNIPTNHFDKLINKLKAMPCIPSKISPNEVMVTMELPSKTAIAACWVPEDLRKYYVTELQIQEDDQEKIETKPLSEDDDDELIILLSDDDEDDDDMDNDIDMQVTTVTKKDNPPPPIKNNIDTNQSTDVRKQFLKLLGVRIGPPASLLVKTLVSDRKKYGNHESILDDLYQQRETLREEDWIQIRKEAKFLLCDRYNRYCGNPLDVEVVIVAPNDCYLSLKHLKCKTKFSTTQFQIWEKIMKQGYHTNRIINFQKEPNFEIINFMEEYLKISPFPCLSRLFTDRLNIATENVFNVYKETIEYFFMFYQIHYKNYLKENPDELNNQVFLSTSGEFFAANQLCLVKNNLCPIVDPFIINEARKYSIDLSELGMLKRASIKEIIAILSTNPSEYINYENAAEVLQILYVTEITAAELKKLKNTAFVPIDLDGNFLKPSQILVKQNDVQEDSDSDIEMIQETNEITNENWNILFPFVNFGIEANQFLISCGAKVKPDSKDLAECFIDGEMCKKYFTSEDFNPSIYLNFEKYLAEVYSLLTDRIKKKLDKCANFLLFNPKSKRYELGLAKNGVLVDNNSWCDLILPLCVPCEEDNELINKLYSKLGSQWLTSVITEIAEPKGTVTVSQTTKKLQALIQQRFELFLHQKNGRPLLYVKKSVEETVFKNLKVREVHSITRKLTYNGYHYTLPNSSEISMCTFSASNCTLFLYRHCEVNYFDVGLSLSKAITSEPCFVEERGTMIAQLLQTPLKSLDARGWAVKRILGKKVQLQGAIDISDDHDVRTVVQYDSQYVPSFQSSANERYKQLLDIVGKSKGNSGNPSSLDPDNQTRFQSAETWEDDCDLSIDLEIDNTLTPKGIQLYRTADSYKRKMNKTMEQAYFSFKDLLEQVFSFIPTLNFNSCKIFMDGSSSLIAFNFNTVLYFNLRYFYQCHYSMKLHKTFSACAFWYVITCHELAHNVESSHNQVHGKITEELIFSFMENLVKNYNA